MYEQQYLRWVWFDKYFKTVCEYRRLAGWVRNPLGGYQGCSFIAVLVLYIYVISGVQHCCIIIYNLNIVHSKQHNVRSSPFVCSRGKLWFICLVLELNKINVARTFCNNRKPCGSAKHHCLRHRSGYRDTIVTFCLMFTQFLLFVCYVIYLSSFCK